MPLDFSECSNHALDYATSFAERLGSSLVLLNVVEPAPGGENYLTVTPALDETNERLVEAGRERLIEMRQRHVGHRTECEVLARMGRVHSEITDTAEALGTDLIIMGTHGHSGLKHVVLGSTAEKVVRHATCPVLTVRHPMS